MQMNKTNEWQRSSLHVFWGEIAPCEHVVQIYENDEAFLGSLEGFISTGLISGEAVIIIATREHISAISKRLNARGFDVDGFICRDHLITVEAGEALSKFMVNDLPDENLFTKYITELFQRALNNNMQIRAFGEMVALLWQNGLNGATVQLEKLWNKLHDNKQFTLFCSYPRIGFTQDIDASMQSICCIHSKILSGEIISSSEVEYKNVPNQLSNRSV